MMEDIALAQAGQGAQRIAGDATTAARTAQPRVLFVVSGMFHYRVEFHRHLRAKLAARGIAYDVAYTDGAPELSGRNDTRVLDFGRKVGARWLKLGPITLCWQNAMRQALDYDLVIVMQENKYLINYVLQALRWFGGPRLAFYGHGRNLQNDATALRERFKRLWVNRVDWWFAYTGLSQGLVAKSGYPKNRISNVENAYDTRALSDELASVTVDELDAFRQRVGLRSGNVGIYMGALYKEKRIGFLIDCAKYVRAAVPNFELLIVGGGADAQIAKDAAAKHSWIHAPGPLFGRDKAIALKASKLFLIPGIVGLAILDAFAAGIPMITAANRYHGPEIDYLRHGENGFMVEPGDDVEAYARTVVSLLRDESKRLTVAAHARADATRYTAENMAEKFADGVVAALAAGRA
jgi:glycosyltransferase involved in cell wall biosynthesis